MAFTLNENLKRWAEQYETADFINADPVQIPHRYDSRVNIEISAFVTAWIAWGNRKQIIKKADFIDRKIFKGEPYHYIVGNTVERGNRPEWEQYQGSTDCLYRTFTFGDFHDLCARLYDVYTSAENMEAVIKKAHETNGETALATLQSLFGSVNGIPDFETQSACKRLCLFLRWMCRKGSPVDFGLWDVCDPRNLIIPLDTHVHKQALRLGLVKRWTLDLTTAIEITERFAEIFPDDPAKGDFALFGYGVNGATADTIKKVTKAVKGFAEASNEAATVMADAEKHLPRTEDAPEPEEVAPEPVPEETPDKKVADMSIEDVLLLPLFYNNVAKQITSLWNDRETARMKAGKRGEKLKSHPIDKLHAAGKLVPGDFVVLFAQVLDKVATGYSTADRQFIRDLGMIAFNETMQKLLDDEKERDNSDGND
jgi:uncharacterized protein (TIGR02757 family)|nr:MAG TPA: Protein of unknown function (DUF2400) [Caudoviricetes sp.]